MKLRYVGVTTDDDVSVPKKKPTKTRRR